MEWLVQIAPQLGVSGVVLLGGALYALRAGWWYPASTVTLLQNRIAELTQDVKDARKEVFDEREGRRADAIQADQRLFNALGVADKLTRTVQEAQQRARRVA